MSDAAAAREAAARAAALLDEHGATVAAAETAAGGLISAALVSIAGASGWFLGGAVAYSGEAKARWLGLRGEDFGPDGVVSAAGARKLAEAVRNATGATWGVAETGIAGPQTGRRSAKPAGLAYLAVAGPVPAEREVRTGLDDRAANQRAFTLAALELLVESLQRARRSAAAPPESRSTQTG